jgi:polysaccharide biosynthesis/export protein
MYKRFRMVLALCLLIQACSLLFSSAWSQSAKPATQPISPTNQNANNSVTPQTPSSMAPAQVAPASGAGQAPANADSSAIAGTSAASPSSDLRIGVGDLIEVAVFGAPEFNKQVRVSSSGDVSLPLIGTVAIAGLTTAEAEKLVEKKLLDGGYFTDPHVSVFAKEYQTQGISVLGEVQKPGIYPMLGSHKLFDVISAAGGTTPKAGNQVTITHRDQSRPSQNVTLSGNSSDSTQNNPDVSPGDTVVVQKAGVVYVVGDVHMPGGFIMDKPELTVLQAVAMAQGVNPTASLDSAKLIRRTGTQPQEIPIPLKKILASKAPDVSLQPDDIVFVPNSAGKSAARRGLEAIVQAATGVAIYHHP